MKRHPLYLAILIALCGASLSAAPTAQASEEKKPSWFERVFGSKEAKEDAKSEEKVAEKESEASTKSEKAEKAKKDSKDLKFSEKDREVLEDWQKGNASWKKSKKKKLPPGLQKKVDRGGELPPGWKKKLEVGTVLDPEIAKVARPLPEEVLSRLPDIPKGTEILQVGDEIIRVIESTREVVDIFDDWLDGDKTED